MKTSDLYPEEAMRAYLPYDLIEVKGLPLGTHPEREIKA